MTIHVYTICRNEAFMMPFFLRHYETFADQIYVIDDDSDDGTREIVNQCEKAMLIDLDTHGLDDAYMAELYSLAPQRISKGKADWVICVDADEFLYGKTDEIGTMTDIDVVIPEGWQMLSETLPSGDGQIYDEIREGIKDQMIDKPVLWKPTVELKYTEGRHRCVPQGNPRFAATKDLKLLHYRFLSKEYVLERHARNWQRMSDRNKVVGSGVHNQEGYPGYQGLAWYEKVLKEKVKCLDGD